MADGEALEEEAVAAVDSAEETATVADLVDAVVLAVAAVEVVEDLQAATVLDVKVIGGAPNLLAAT